MSRPVRDKMLGLDADLDAVRFPAASTIRARGKRRAHRRTAIGAAAVTTAMVLAGVGVAVSMTSSGDTTEATVDAASRGDNDAAPRPPCVTPSVPLDLALPADPSRVTLQVVDAAGDPGRSTELADRLRTRGFTIRAGAAPGAEPTTATTVIRYGPSAIGAASLLDVYVDGPVAMKLVPDRDGRTVDLVLGESAVRLRSATEVNQALVRLGEPTHPAELCGPGQTGK